MATEVPVLRSKLFIPGNRVDWMRKAGQYGADALVLDLEDAVPPREKAAAREMVGDFISEGTATSPLFVRVNDLSTAECLADLRVIVRPGLTGVVLPKAEHRDDIVFVDRLLGYLEQEAGMEPGSVLLNPLVETAPGIHFAYEIAAASNRVAYTGALAPRGGDVEASIGYRWSPEGEETLTLRSQVLLAVRAAGVPNPMCGLWTDLDDIDGLRAFARRNRALGYEGMIVIHPGHLDVVHEIFGPSDVELEHYRAIVAAMAAAEAEGSAAARLDGELIDIAALKNARANLARAGWTVD